jgi:hypothetical protein
VRTALAGYIADEATATERDLADALAAYDAADAAERAAMQETTRRLNEHLARTLGFATSSPNYRYWQHGGVRYCYNTSPTDEDGGKWFAWEYRPVRGKTGQLAIAHKVKCATRTKAKAKAYEWYRKAKGSK